MRVSRPLATYLETLETIAAGEYDRVYPGHREPIDNPAARAKEILEHHRERAERVFAVVHDRGPVDTWTVSAYLFGELNEIHILHGPGEAWAHLTHIVESGVVADTPDGYVATAEATRVSETSLLGQ